MKQWGLILVMACSSAPGKQQPAAPDPVVAQVVTVDAAPDAPPVDAAPPDAPVDAASIVVDEGQPKIFDWNRIRDENERWLASPPSFCDPRSPQHPRRPGEPECMPTSKSHGLRIAALVTSAFERGNDKHLLVTIDRGFAAAISKEFWASILDRDNRPRTAWVHVKPRRDDQSEIILPQDRKLVIEAGKTHVAVIETILPQDVFPTAKGRP